MIQQDWLILLTNDDGAEARGLLTLKAELAVLGSVVVVAPHDERSAVSHGLTIHHPIRTIKIAKNHFALTGTPADCVIFAIRKLLPRPPDLVISGINRGANLGDDIIYSGTVAGAREAANYNIPSIAASLVTRDQVPNYRPAGRFLQRIIPELVRDRIPGGTFLNINIPKGRPNHSRFTRQGSKLATSSIEEKKDPRGRKYYWISRDEIQWTPEPDTDYQAILDQTVSITPLQKDQTDYRTLKRYGEQAHIRISD